jgi:two-component system response regulator YesN
MIKLLVIDDEQDIREGLKCSIDWEENDILIVGDASNGLEALDIINNTFPDIILVDIRMPLMNGLQLIESISSTHPYIKAIIISGYDDFIYAKKALSLGAVDYLLKPCRPDEILSSVLKTKAFVEKERQQKEIISLYKSGFYVSEPFIKSRYLTSLLKGDGIKDELLINKFEFLNLQISKYAFRVMILRLDSYASLLEKAKPSDIDLIKFATMNIAEEIIRSKYNCEVFEYNDDIVIILNIEKNKQICPELINNIKAEINRTIKQTVSIGISNFCNEIIMLQQFYKEALVAVEHRFFLGENSTIYFCNIKNTYTDSQSYPLDLEKQIIGAIKSDNKKEVQAYFENFFKFIMDKDFNKQFILKSCMSLLFSIYHLALENGVEGNEILKEIDTLEELSRFGTLDHLKKKICDIVLLVFGKINQDKIGNKFVQSAIDYINENYSKNIDLETVAKNIYISSSYVSTLFKQVIGINFVDYLHTVRLNKACELLKDSKLKAYEVAYMVGYNDDKYFSQIFKKHLGLTPSQYRDSLI